MNIFFACNKNYYELLMVAIHSLQKNNENLRFYIYYLSDDNNEYECIKKLINSTNNELVFIDHFKVNNLLPKFLKNYSYISVETYVRLIIPFLIKEDYVLYLDPDVIIRGDLSELLDIKNDLYDLAAVPYEKNLGWLIERNKSLGMEINHPYFNTGVLLLNLRTLKKTHLFNSAIDLIRNNPNINDQDALNLVVRANYFKLDNKYNWTLHDVNFTGEPLIIHFAGYFKPNQAFYIHPYINDFRQYYKEVFPNKRLPIKISYIRFAFIKAFIKHYIFRLYKN